MLKLLLLVLFRAVGWGTQWDWPDPPAETYRLPTGLELIFMTRGEGQAMKANEFKLYEDPGYTLLGLFSPASGGHTPWLFVIVDDPSIYTPEYLQRLANMYCAISAHHLDFQRMDLLADRSDEEWLEAGVLFHELAHASDASIYSGHQDALVHALFPRTPAPAADEPAQNPWQILRVYWPTLMTHPGNDLKWYK